MVRRFLLRASTELRIASFNVAPYAQSVAHLLAAPFWYPNASSRPFVNIWKCVA
jgi:hypothetical protein